MIGGQQSGQRLHQVYPGPAHIEAGEVARQHPVGQFPQSGGHLDTGGTAADDHELKQPVIDQLRLAAGAFELGQYVAAQVVRFGQCLQEERVLGDAGDAEVVIGGAGRLDEVVETDAAAVVEQHGPVLPADAGHAGEGELDVALAAQAGADAAGDLVRFEQCCRDLVEERLGGVVVVPVDDGYVYRRVALGAERTHTCV